DRSRPLLGGGEVAEHVSPGAHGADEEVTVHGQEESGRDAKHRGDPARRVAPVEVRLLPLVVAEDREQHPAQHDEEEHEDECAGAVEELVDAPAVHGCVVGHQESRLRAATTTTVVSRKGAANRASTSSVSSADPGLW